MVLQYKWFKAISDGVKTHEIRAWSPFWQSRLSSATHLVFSHGCFSESLCSFMEMPMQMFLFQQDCSSLTWNSGYGANGRLPPLRIIGMKISRRVEALEHGVQPGELQHLFQNYDQIVIIEFQRYQKEPCTETSTLSTQFKSIYIYSTLYLYMQKVHMYVLCISFDSPGARGCPRGKWKTHGGVVKTEYLQDPKGRNLKTWPHHMDDTLVIGS